MASVYKNATAQTIVRTWCLDVLDAWSQPHSRSLISTSGGNIHIVTSGHRHTDGPPVLVVPGTSFNAATMLHWSRALSSEWLTHVMDVPGQAGLSAPGRPRFHRLEWYGRIMTEILDDLRLSGAILVGDSLGAAIALACDSPRIAGRVLVSPGGIIRLAVKPSLLRDTLPWMADATKARTIRLLRHFTAPGAKAPASDVEWMSLVGKHCRSTLAPPPLPMRELRRAAAAPCLVATGEYDEFLAPQRLRPAVERLLGTGLRVIPDMGHLTTPRHIHHVKHLVSEAVEAIGRASNADGSTREDRPDE